MLLIWVQRFLVKCVEFNYKKALASTFIRREQNTFKSFDILWILSCSVSNRVVSCYDEVKKGTCKRKDCKFFHPPNHLKNVVNTNGRNNLRLRYGVSLDPGGFSQFCILETSWRLSSELCTARARPACPPTTPPTSPYLTTCLPPPSKPSRSLSLLSLLPGTPGGDPSVRRDCSQAPGSTPTM